MNTKFNRQQGFTLVELVVVIAILGVLSAVAVPFIASHLGESKDRAYEVDRERFQQAVDAFFSRPSNLNFIGKPQYPIMGIGKSRGTFILENHVHASDHPNSHEFHNENHGLASAQSFDHIRISEDLRQIGNPLGGTQGGAPRWVDDGDGIRDGVEEELLDNDIVSVKKTGWHVATISREGTQYIVDSRDYFIDFGRLVAMGLLDQVPDSASPDNRPQDPPNFVPLTLPGNNNPGGFTITPPTTTVAIWIVDRTAAKVFKYSLEGPLLDEFPLAPSNQDATGIATDGSNFWVLDADDKQVYRYNLDGGPELVPFDITTSSTDLNGIATDGTSIWILDSGTGVFRYSSAGVYQNQTFTLEDENTGASGLTTDGTTIWVVDRDVDRVFSYTTTGVPLGSFNVAPALNPEGLASDGTNIWVVDRDTNKIYPFGMEGGSPGATAGGLYDGSYSWFVNKEGKVLSLFFFFPEQDKTGFQSAYP